MKTHILAFDEIEQGTKVKPPYGIIHIISSKPIACFGTLLGVEVLLGTGTEIKLRQVDVDELWFESQNDAPARAWLYNPASVPIETTGVVFTSVDRQPLNSGHMAELAADMRRFRLEQRAMLDIGREQLRHQKAEIEKATKKADKLREAKAKEADSAEDAAAEKEAEKRAEREQQAEKPKAEKPAESSAE